MSAPTEEEIEKLDAFISLSYEERQKASPELRTEIQDIATRRADDSLRRARLSDENLARENERLARVESEITAKARAEGKFPADERFIPTFRYKDGRDPYMVDHLVRIESPKGSRERLTEFYIEEEWEGLPVLPLRGTGSVWHTGWDIPTCWAIDSAGVCWMDSAHGGSLGRVTSDQLLAEAKEDLSDLQTIHELLGRKPPLPEWIRTALQKGWTPPSDFRREDFEETV